MTTTKQPTRVYLAGPMFSDGDKMEQRALAADLEAAGFSCYLPQKDGIEVASVMQLLNDPALHGSAMLEPLVLDRCIAWVTRAVVSLDIFQVVQGCQCTVLNIDGRVPDEGALVEATLAWSTGHPVVSYKTTAISELDGNNNPMVGVVGGWAPVPADSRAVVAALKAAEKSAASESQPLLPPPLQVQQLIKLGGSISAIRGRPPLNKTQRTAAARTLADLPPALLELLEPVVALQAMCQQLVLAVVEFSKIDSTKSPKRTKIFVDEIAALHDWVAQPGIRNAILSNPMSC